MPPNHALVVIHDRDERERFIRDILREHGFEFVETVSARDAIHSAAQNSFDVFVLTHTHSDPGILETFRRLKAIDADVPIIVSEVDPLPASAKEKLMEEAFDLLPTPIQRDRWESSLKHALRHRRLLLQVRSLTKRLDTSLEVQNSSSKGNRQTDQSPTQSDEVILIGQSQAIADARRSIEEVANSDLAILIRGESGTGKGVVARLIHEASDRADSGRFIKINCPSVPEQLLESELFGHEAGAFTGALKCKPGRLELAAAGTVFLDEIGEVSVSEQAKLLQIFEHREFTRLGGERTISVDVRIIAATNAPLEDMIQMKTFRSDLYYRLNQYTIHLLPLRQRIEDIPHLVNYFISKYGPIYGAKDIRMTERIMSRLLQYSWPGNVRELESTIRRYALTGDEDAIWSLTVPQSDAGCGHSTGTYHESEKAVILAALIAARWNRRSAARTLGISYNTLRRRISTFNLDSVDSLSASLPKIPSGEGLSHMLTDRR